MKICTKCKIEKEFAEFGKCKGVKSGLKSACKKCLRADNRFYYNNNLEKESQRKKKSYLRDREKIIKKTSAYNINRRKTDPIFRLKHNLRKRIRSVLLSKRLNKNNTFAEYIGCTLSELKIHIETQFEPGMSWGNYGEWEIDHILPFAQHTDLKIIYARCHYTNLRPMWMSENRSKHDKE